MSETMPQQPPDPNEYMRSLREFDLTASPVGRGIYATEQFPKIYGLLMEWPESQGIFSVSVTGMGDANLYTTAGIGLLGGAEDAVPLRNAARNLVEVGQQFHDVARPVNQFPYPQPGQTHFYLLTYTDVRLLIIVPDQEGKLSALEQKLFACATDVYTTIKLILAAEHYEKSAALQAAAAKEPASAKAVSSPQQLPPANTKPEDVGRALRTMMLTKSAADFGAEPSEEFAQIYAVLIDIPTSGGNFATVFGAATGEASLYTSSTFGVLGGGAYSSIRAAARRVVKIAEQYLDASRPTTEFPYPPANKVYYYLLTFSGVRVLEDDLAAASSGSGATAGLFHVGQELFSQLRLASGVR